MIIDNEIQTGTVNTVVTVNSNYVSLSNLTNRNGRSDGIDVTAGPSA